LNLIIGSLSLEAIAIISCVTFEGRGNILTPASPSAFTLQTSPQGEEPCWGAFFFSKPPCELAHAQAEGGLGDVSYGIHRHGLFQ